MGPAFAAPVAPKAIADRARTEAIAVIEIIFMLSSPLTWMPTLNMEIGDRRGDYKESNLGSSIRWRRLREYLCERLDGFHRA